MIELSTAVSVSGVSSKQVFDFMLDCSDSQYSAWWPGVHFQFHTVKRNPEIIGSVVYFDKLIGSRRVKSKAVIVEIEKNRRIVWQMKLGFRVPVYVNLEIEKEENTVKITHCLKAGFSGYGRIFDGVFRLFLNEKFAKELDSHAKKEFVLLAKLIRAA